MKKKNLYESAELELICFGTADVITASGWDISGKDDENSDPNGWT